jgi:hypothetical protein
MSSIADQIIQATNNYIQENPDIQDDIKAIRSFVFDAFKEQLNQLTFGECAFIDETLFGHTDNGYWASAFNFPVEDEELEVGIVENAGIFTFSVFEESDTESDAESDAESDTKSDAETDTKSNTKGDDKSDSTLCMCCKCRKAYKRS